MNKTVNLENHVLIGKTKDELESFAVELGEKPFRGRQLFDWLYRQKVYNVNQMTDLPSLFRALVKNSSFGFFSVGFCKCNKKFLERTIPEAEP